MDVDARIRLSRRPNADARLRGYARGRDGGVRQELATGVSARKPLPRPCLGRASEHFKRKGDHGSVVSPLRRRSTWGREQLSRAGTPAAEATFSAVVGKWWRLSGQGMYLQKWAGGLFLCKPDM